MRPRHASLLFIVLVFLLWIALAGPLPATARMQPASGSAGASIHVAPTSQNIELVTHLGSPEVVTVQGDYAYVGKDSQLVVLDISDPTQPRQVGSLLFPGRQRIDNIVLSGSYAYITSSIERQLKIVDVANPVAPQEVGAFSPDGGISDVVVVGDYAYLAGSFRQEENLKSVLVINVSNPHTVAEVASIRSPGNGVYGRVEAEGNYLYFLSWYDGLIVYDIADPQNPRQLGNYNPSAIGNLLVVRDGYAYIVSAYTGLEIVDVSDPSSLRPKGYLPIYPNAVAIAGGYAFVSVSDEVGFGGEEGIHIIDISDPENPQERLVYETPKAKGLAVEGSHLYLADGVTGFNVIDISAPAAPVTLYSEPERTIGFVTGMLFVGEYLYINDELPTDSGTMLKIFDVSNPAEPHMIKEIEIGLYSFAVIGERGYSVFGSSITVIDLSDPLNPMIVAQGYFDGPIGGYQAAALNENYLYITGSSNCSRNGCSAEGLWVVDISDPNVPETVTVLYEEFADRQVEIVGNYLYAAETIYDISDPIHPIEVGPLAVRGKYEIKGNFLYELGETGLQVWDVSNPATPVMRGAHPLFSAPSWSSMEVYGSRVYIKADSLYVIDVTDPDNPIGLAYDSWPPLRHGGVIGRGDVIYTSGDGLFVHRYTGGTFSIHQTFLPLLSQPAPSVH